MRAIGLRQRGTYILIFLLSAIIADIFYNTIKNEILSHSNLASHFHSGVSGSSAWSEDYLASTKEKPGNDVTDKYCREKTIENIMKVYSQDWMKQEDFITLLRSELNSKCNGVVNAIVTQSNSPLGSNITYDSEKRITKVTPKLFDTFVKDSPFVNKTFKTCSVVGNGGVLANSSCGEEIDSAQFVIRCNLAPLDKGYKRDVGNKTNLVTSNPSILVKKFESLMELRRPFMERLGTFGDSLVLMPTFTYMRNTAVTLRVLYTVHDFQSPALPIFLNPEYIRNLAQFWETRGLKKRLSTGIMMVSLALELCDEVNLYGFWPYPQHPRDCRSLTNHYYDDVKAKSVHAMPVEFNRLLQLHTLGVIRLHLGDCSPRPKQTHLSFFLH
ncbi:alpha-2,8-sialyltransferase 8F-like [Brienomyrus brachyistius]|uniref:alpha-2,8-sialyltransferase 8F-like n=1 Tax=Brienomyrus brachyistius TaxID=42636 RepID=UPI0020B2BF29|nr:alpha-2,8-sialyltransferase 8F-like [Brienomyrus brachyistius]